MTNIQFTPEILYYLPIYLQTDWANLTKEQCFKYSKYYMYKLSKAEVNFSVAVQVALNELWNNLGLDYDDLNNIYKLIEIIEEGSKKAQK